MAEDSGVNLDGITLLAELTDKQRQAIAQQCVPLSFTAQQQIIDQASDTTNVYFVLTGRVRVVNYSLLGREVSLEDVDAGGHFAELAAIDGQPRSASVMAYSDAELASLSPLNFNKMIDKHRIVSRQVMMSLAGIVCRSTDRIMDLSTLGANNRVHA
jgi:CRP/FNR family cyclic AMP-dependent transcriptional regulator